MNTETAPVEIEANLAWFKRNRVKIAAVITTSREVAKVHGEKAGDACYLGGMEAIRDLDPDNGGMK